MPDPIQMFSESLFGDWLMREIDFITETAGDNPDSALNLTLIAYKSWLMAPLLSMTAGAAAVEISIRKAQELAQVVQQAADEKKDAEIAEQEAYKGGEDGAKGE